MDVKSFYEAVGGSYQGALAIMMNDMLITRMLSKFMDNNCCQAIIDAYDKKVGSISDMSSIRFMRI